MKWCICNFPSLHFIFTNIHLFFLCFSYEASKFESKAPEMPNVTNQPPINLINTPLASKAFSAQQVQHSGVKLPNINDYFESKQNYQNSSVQPKLYYTQTIANSFNSHTVSSGSSGKMPIPPMPPQEEVNQNIDTRTKRFTPSPQQRISRTPPLQLQQSIPHVNPPTEAHDSNDLMKFNNPPSIVNPPSYPITSTNVITPLAASSPVASITLLPENQERIPENREYPDNTENIAQEFKSLSINPAKEVSYTIIFCE